MTAAVLRAERYRLLAECARHPDEGLLAELFDEAPSELDSLVGRLRPLLDQELAAEHVRLFAQGALVSPYEGSYVRADKGALLGQLATLYALFGARVGGAEREPPDHIGVELEFAALLAIKEAICLHEGNEEHLTSVRRGRELFIAEHLGRWARPFARRLAVHTRHAFFRAFAELLEQTVEHDAEQQGIELESACTSLPLVDQDPLRCPASSD